MVHTSWWSHLKWPWLDNCPVAGWLVANADTQQLCAFHASCSKHVQDQGACADRVDWSNCYDYSWFCFVAGPSGMQAQANEDGPSAPDLQLDWLSSSSDSDDTDDDSGIEVVSVKYQQQSAQKVSWCELWGEKCIGISWHRGWVGVSCEVRNV